MTMSTSIDSSEWIPLLEDTSTVATFIQNTQTDTAAAALLVYDYLLTLPDEVRLMWRLTHNLSTVLYLVIRYGALLTSALVMANGIPSDSYHQGRMSAYSCHSLYSTATAVHVLLTIAISAFVAARIMALWSCNWSLGTCLFILGLINSSPMTRLLFFAFYGGAAPRPLPGCLEGTDSAALAQAVSVYVPTATSAVNIVYEILCLALTFAKTWRVYRLQLGKGTRPRLTDFLLRDGTLYFIAMIVLGVFNIVSSVDPTGFPAGGTLNESLSRSLVPILVTRFITNLRTAHDQRGDDVLSSGDQAVSSVQFKTRTERFLHFASGELATEVSTLDRGERI